MSIDFDALDKLHAEATPGPWTTEIDMYGKSGQISIPEIERILHDTNWADPEDWDRDETNAKLICALRNAYPALREHIWELESERDEAQRQMEQLDAEREFRAECEARRTVKQEEIEDLIDIRCIGEMTADRDRLADQTEALKAERDETQRMLAAAKERQSLIDQVDEFLATRELAAKDGDYRTALLHLCDLAASREKYFAEREVREDERRKVYEQCKQEFESRANATARNYYRDTEQSFRDAAAYFENALMDMDCGAVDVELEGVDDRV